MRTKKIKSWVIFVSFLAQVFIRISIRCRQAEAKCFQTVLLECLFKLLIFAMVVGRKIIVGVMYCMDFEDDLCDHQWNH